VVERSRWDRGVAGVTESSEMISEWGDLGIDMFSRRGSGTIVTVQTRL